jgi:hypothetical protein
MCKSLWLVLEKAEREEGRKHRRKEGKAKGQCVQTVLAISFDLSRGYVTGDSTERSIVSRREVIALSSVQAILPLGCCVLCGLVPRPWA